jgi:death-on-curing protein
VGAPIWVAEAVVLAVHRRQLAEHGGSDGVRDAALLTSALTKAQNLYQYSDPKPDLAAMAATYAYGICRNHPFVDGNKRTALVIAQLFLRLNGAKLSAPAAEKYRMTMKLGAGEVSENALADWMREWLR